ncbi:uncharacterized protein LOC103521360 [Trichonephila clavipes]|nr:uncharacterized protein LOC103521360 [Trichonephila clavipes]
MSMSGNVAQWHNGKHLGYPAKSVSGPPSWVLRKVDIWRKPGFGFLRNAGVLDLVLNVRKRDLSPTALHAIALETINTRFPPEEWLHIYTDGSLLDFSQGAGIGVFSHLFSFYLHAGPLTTHFDGEVEAIHIALQQLAVRLPPIERAVILSDSTSALQALSNYNENNCLRVQNCRELLGKIKGKIVFQWVPSHCGLLGK